MLIRCSYGEGSVLGRERGTLVAVAAHVAMGRDYRIDLEIGQERDRVSTSCRAEDAMGYRAPSPVLSRAGGVRIRGGAQGSRQFGLGLRI